GIWKIPVEGGEAVQVTGPRSVEGAFDVRTRGIYYVAAPEQPNQSIVKYLDFATGQTRTVFVTDHEIGMGMSVSNDERFLIFPQRDHPGADLMLIKNFSLP